MRSGRSGPVALLLAGLAAASASAPDRAAGQTMDDHVYTWVSFDELEYAPGAAERPLEYDAQAWIGGDYDRLWLKARGEQSTVEGAGGVEAEALYSRAVSAFWNAQAGLRLDHHWGGGDGATRGLVALGLQGLAPYWIEVESFLYVSHEGDVSARLEASWELLVTQRLVLEPELELGMAVQDVPELGVGSGLGEVELGARLRYEIVREMAPYVGFSWLRRAGETADLARAAGRPASDGSVVIGLRWWY